jgi:hypothetical protein
LKILLHIFIIFIFLGCVKEPSIPLGIENLEKTFLSIDNTIDRNESAEFAYKILEYTSSLKYKYDLEYPPLYHNFLVNSGLKNRGLCWHFANDMLIFILDQKYKSFDYYIVGASIDDYWDEHNAIVVTCKGCSYKQGIILDAWRNSGNLYYSTVEDDYEYKWIQRGQKINSKFNIRY